MTTPRLAPEELRELLDFAVEIARLAGQSTLPHFHAGVRVEIKADRSPVTIADRESEQLLRTHIERRYPGDGIVGEEYGITREEAPRRWILDPIDGTRSFVRGVPLYGVLVALEVGDEALVGAIRFPALDETVSAARGLGCHWNGRRVRVSEITELGPAAILSTESARPHRDSSDPSAFPPGWESLIAQARTVRTWGDCYGHALVATGRAEAMVDPRMEVWDCAALRPVIEEAGGVFTDLRGRPTHRGGSALSTNAALAGEIRRLLGAEPGRP